MIIFKNLGHELSLNKSASKNVGVPVFSCDCGLILTFMSTYSDKSRVIKMDIKYYSFGIGYDISFSQDPSNLINLNEAGCEIIKKFMFDASVDNHNFIIVHNLMVS